MASTNKTTNYELSQYIGTDKPTYLTDYNQDMSKIDAGIHAAKSEADTNSNAIGDLTNLTTTAKTSLVAAANEIDADVATNTNNIATNTSNIATNTTHIGTLTNLTTTAKTDLVVASNEINAKVGNISSLNTTNKSSTVAAINEVISYFNLTATDTISYSNMTASGATLLGGEIKTAINDNGTLGKLYGHITFSKTSDNMSISFDTSFRPATDIVINNLSILRYDALNEMTLVTDVSLSSAGKVTITMSDQARGNGDIALIPVLLFIKDFGDVPQPPQV